MRPRVLLLVLLACGGAARAQDRGPAEILDDHAAALGDAGSVRTLAASCQAGDGQHTVPGQRTIWDLAAGRCLREIPTSKGDYPWREHFGPEGAFLSRGFFERYRANQHTTRGGYYMMKALAEPFPLRPYLANAALRRTLRRGTAEGRPFEVLYAPPDDNGVRAVFLLDERTHLLANLRFYDAKGNELANVSYSEWKKTGPVMLPGAIYVRLLAFEESMATQKLVPRPMVREERAIAWEINPALEDDAFFVPGLGSGGGPQDTFERRVLPTGPDPHEVAVGDVDGDGKADVAVACEGGVWVHFGGAEERPVAVELGVGHYRGLAIDDLDCDGRLEIVTSSNVEPARTFWVVSFDGKRVAARRRIGGAPAFTTQILTPDLDRDGLADLVAVGFATRDLQIRFGNGAGGIRPVGSPWPLDPKGTGQRRGFGVAAGNLDGDSLTDFAVADGTRVVIFRGQPNLSFQPRLSIPPEDTWEWRAVAVAWADLDRDGYDDLLVAREHPLEDLRDDLRVVRNLPAGEGPGARKLEAGEPLDVGARVQAVAAGSFDEDPAPDVVATSFLTGELTLLPNDGKGGLDAKAAERYPSGRGSCRLAVADVDGDGRDDVVVANRLDDTVSVFLGRRGPAVRRRREPRAEPCAGPTQEEFRMEGLSHPYEFAGEFRLPASMPDPSGIVCMGGVVNSQFVLVSDKRNALFRGTLDRAGRRFLVGPPVPLRGLEPGGLDLEDVAFDRWTGTLFLAAESDSSILRCTIFGDVLGRVPTGIAAPGNDGVEAIALRRKLDGTPLLYVFRERMGVTGLQPPVLVFEPDDAGDVLSLRPRGGERRLPLYLPDQTAAVVADERLYVVSRLARGICEVGFEEDGFAREGVRTANFKRLMDDLGLGEGDLAKYGNVEGIALDPQGDLFLLVDNNGEMLGREGRNRGREGRLLWFRDRGERKTRAAPVRVVVKHIHVPVRGAEGVDEGVSLTREEAQALAQDIARRAREGEDFEALAASPEGGHYALSPWGREMQIVKEGSFPGAQVKATDLPVALARLAFNLDVGEVGVCDYHPEESPRGYHVLLRIE